MRALVPSGVKLFFGLMLAAITLLGVAYFAVRDASADHNGPWLSGDLGPVQRQIIAQGFATYCFDAASAAYPGFKVQAAQVVAAATSAHGIPAYEVPWGPDCMVRNTMPPDSQFGCGSGAAACITSYSSPVTIYYRRALGYADWRSTQCHEGVGNSGHLLWLHEQYNDRAFTSNGRTWTCMDFGTGVWQTTEWDRDRIWNATVADAPCPRLFIVQGGWTTLGWGQQRCDGGAAHLHEIGRNSNATVVSFGWSAPGSSDIIWTGDICGPDFGYCNSSYAAGERGFDSFWTQPGACFFLRAGNAATWFVPQASAPGFYVWLGCVP